MRVPSCVSYRLFFRQLSDSFSPAVPLPRPLRRVPPRESSLPVAPGIPGAQTGAQTNPILSQFLDSDGDGDVDMQDVVRLTSVFLRK